MGLERESAKLGVGYRHLQLYAGGRKTWRHEPNCDLASVERTVLSVYEREGWYGHECEGLLMLSLIKAASFPILPDDLNSAYIESLYDCGFYGDSRGQIQITNPTDMLECVRNATPQQIATNLGFRTIASPFTAAGNTNYIGKALGLFYALGSERLYAIASVFAEAPYDMRAGWPDLTLWRDGTIVFREVKAPGDRLHASQKRLISKLLIPLGYDVEIVQVSEIPSIIEV